MKTTRWMGAALAVFAFGCAQTQTTSAQRGVQQPRSRELSGKVSDVAGNAILIESPDHQAVALDITDQSDFRLNGQKVSPMELPRGADIRVSYELRGDRPVVVRADAKNSALVPPIENAP